MRFMTDPRDRFINHVAAGTSFAEIGGLWGTVNERVSVAHAAGARSLTMIDLSPAGSHWWQAFDLRCAERGVGDVVQISGDVLELSARPDAPAYDVVHCSGVLYHMPDPLKFLAALRRVTRQHLVLTSAVTADEIHNDAGSVTVPAGGALFVPALSPAERAVLHADWYPMLGEHALGITRDTEWNLNDFAPWWWLPTVRCLSGMCEAAGFTVVDGGHTWNDHAYTLLLRVRGAQVS
jgi:SAM-dependent methyltransferase